MVHLTFSLPPATGVGDAVMIAGRSCHRAAPCFLFRGSRAVLHACPHRKAPIGIEHALSCLTVQLTRTLTFAPGFCAAHLFVHNHAYDERE